MIFTVGQLLAHAVGDYLIQSDWMAIEKTRRSWPAVAHAVTYGLPFLLFRPSPAALAVIVVTHFVIDRWRLARYVVWAKNFLGPIRKVEYRWEKPECGQWCHLTEAPEGFRRIGRTVFATQNPTFAESRATGYPPAKPDFMAVWLMIIADNVLHVLVNGLALHCL